MRVLALHRPRLLRLVVTAACLGMWLWVLRWPTVATVATAVGLLTAFAALTVAEIRKRNVAMLLVVAVTLIDLAQFYLAMDDPEPLRERLTALPHGRALLAASALWALGDALFSAEPALASALAALSRGAARSATQIVYGVSLLVVTVFAAELFFVGEGTPFAYPKPKLHPIGVTAGNRAGYHAAERVVADMRQIGFTQEKQSGTVRILLNGASTMWGFRLPPSDAPAAVLRDLLAKHHPDRRFEVVLLAWPGKCQLNEVVDSAVTIPHWQPDLVLSFNGFNEVWFQEDTDRYEALPPWQPYVQDALSVPPGAALFYANSHYGAQAWPSLIRGSTGPIGLQRPHLYEPPRYYDYLYTTARILAERRIRYVHAFTPNRFEMEATESIDDPSLAGVFTEVRERRRLSRRIVESAHQQSYDVMASLANLSADKAFLDHCHLATAGVHAIMADVARHVAHWLEAPLPDAPFSPPSQLAPLRLSVHPAADFLTIGVGWRANSTLRSTGQVGLLQSGPGLEVPAGRYRTRWYGTVESSGVARVDLVARDGAAQLHRLAEARAELSENPKTHQLAALDAEFSQDARGLEFRFFIDASGLRLTLQRILFEQVWTD